MVRLALALALVALAACDGKPVLTEPVTVERHGVIVSASNSEDGKLRISLRNGRAERISTPASTLWFHQVDGVATIALGPRELYYWGYPHQQYQLQADGIDSGSTWESVVGLPDEQVPPPEKTPAHRRNGKPAQRHEQTPTRIERARLRVWIFPHVGIGHDLLGRRYEVLPFMNIDPAPSKSSLRGDSEQYRTFSPTVERDVFRSPRYDAGAESSLYFVETDIELAKPLEIHWFTDDE